MEHISAYTDEKAKKLSQGPKFVRWAVMLGIIVALNILFIVIRGLAFPEPQYNDFCPANPAPAPTTQAACTTAGGAWTGVNGPVAQVSEPTKIQNGGTIATAPEIPAGYCDMTVKCNASYQAAENQYQLHGFILLIALGVLAIIIGVLPLGSSIVSTGLSYGGVLAFVIGSAQYWGNAGNWLRLGISVIALGALIYIGLKRFRD
jgi:hypothetical protein